MLRRKILSFKRIFLPRFFTSKDMLKYLKIDKIKVGKNTIFYDPASIIVDTIRPELLEIGEYCKITSGVTILTHDYSRSVLRRVYGDVLGEAKKTIIGNNCFIGMKAIILMGAQIGDNTIVGAGSVVSGKFPPNVVIAGNPAKIIRTLDEHYKIRLERTKNEAIEYVKIFYDFYKRWPKIKEMHHFFPLFLERSTEALKANNISLKLNGDCEAEILRDFLNSKPLYNGFEEFLDVCKKNMESE